MKFWWVNHKQTYKEEIEGGYIWSPKTNKGGSRNQPYVNLTRTQAKDLIFSYAGGEVKAVGVVSGTSLDSDRPKEFGAVGEQWEATGWLVTVAWSILLNPIRPREYVRESAPLLPEKHSPLKPNGKGNQGCYLAEISGEFAKLLLKLMQARNDSVDDAINELADAVAEDIEERRIEGSDIITTEKEQLIRARRGQGIFRMRVEKRETGCRFTGIQDKRLLVASHIKPWRSSDTTEKLDGDNGFLMSPRVDKLFDGGWLSISDNGGVMCADAGIASAMQRWGLDLRKNVGHFNERQKKYLGYHRQNIFNRRRKVSRTLERMTEDEYTSVDE